MTGTFEGVGATLNFSPDNKFCYGYSGQKTTDGGVWSANTELLNFTTGSEYIIGTFIIHTDLITGYNLFIAIQFNDVTVLNMKTDGVPPYGMELLNNAKLIIPPFTKVEFLFGTQGVTTTATGILSGVVHGAIEQQNLESITDDNKWASL